MPKKFRSGNLSADSTKNFPEPEPRSTSISRSVEKISRKESGSRMLGGNNSIATGQRKGCAPVRLRRS